MNNKKLTMLVGVVAVGVVAYLLWQKSQKPKKNLIAAPTLGPIGQNSTGQLIFRGTRGRLLLPAGSSPFISENGEWMVCIIGECVYLTGTGAVTQAEINQLLPNY